MSLTIKELSEADRPREKMMLRGADALTDAELMAILIGSGSKNMTAVELAQQILKKYDNKLGRLVRLSSVGALCDFKGMGPAKAITLMAALELGRRLPIHTGEPEEKPVVTSSAMAYAQLRPYLINIRDHEEVWALFLDRAKHPITCQCVSRGGLSESVVDMRMIFRPAIEFAADSIILAHNHPSGRLQPSGQDKNITQRAQEVGKIMGIEVLDHLIIGYEGGYYSFADGTISKR